MSVRLKSNWAAFTLFAFIGEVSLFPPVSNVKFHHSVSADALYQGCNAEMVDGVVPFKLPRSLYHLFFIYFAIQERLQTVRPRDYQIVSWQSRLVMNHPEAFDSNIIDSTLYKLTRETLNRDINSFFLKRNLQGNTCQWKEIALIIDEIWDSFLTKDPFPVAKIKDEIFIKNFYTYIHSETLHDPFTRHRAKSLLTQVIAFEWIMDPSKKLLYRSGNLKNDDIVGFNGVPHSLSFACTPLSGIVHDLGACPLFYKLIEIGTRQLYVLAVSENKLKRYFFDPGSLAGIYPLIAEGEFSHLRLRHYPSNSTYLRGICLSKAPENVIKYMVFDSTQKPTITSISEYRDKIRKIFHKCIHVFDMPQLNAAKL